MVVWLIVLAVLCSFLYLNQVGLPEFVKSPLLEKLRGQGVDLQFSRLRLRWYEGIVAENVRFGQVDRLASPQLTADRVRVHLDTAALWKRRLQVDGLDLLRGRLEVPLAGRNGVRRSLALDNIRTQLRFLPNDQWQLDNFTAVFSGINIRVSGIITNASAVRQWSFLRAKESTPAGAWENRLTRFSDTWERIQFEAPPEVDLRLEGDAVDLRTFSLELGVKAAGAVTPWGTVADAHFQATLFPADTQLVSMVQLKLEALQAQTKWASVTNFTLGMLLRSLPQQTNRVNGVLTLSAEAAATRWACATNVNFELTLTSLDDDTNRASATLDLSATAVTTRWASANQAKINARWIHAITNAVPLSGSATVRCGDASSRWGDGEGIRLALEMEQLSTERTIEASLGWWTNLAPYAVRWDAQASRFRRAGLTAADAVCSGAWRIPGLNVTNLSAKLYGGHFDARGKLDVLNRATEVSLLSDVDPHQVEPLLTEGARKWLDQCTWNKAPELVATAGVVLPAWTNRAPDWRGEVLPTLKLDGYFKLADGASYRGVQVSSVRSHFLYSDMQWYLPDLVVTRPEGALKAEHRANDRTKDFYWHLTSGVDLGIVKPLLDEKQQQGMALLELTQPPCIDAEIWGRFHDRERTGARAHVILTNFSFRGQSMSYLETEVRYTNEYLECLSPRVERGSQRMRADGLAADFRADRVYLTNGYSTAEPLVVARAIGPKVGKTMENYLFSAPPTAYVHGTIPMHGEEGADLHFDVDGGPFHWWKFNLPHLAAHVHWAGLHLSLTNLQADFYDGKATGAAEFDFPRGQATQFHFQATTTNTQLRLLLADLTAKTNRAEGRLSGSVVVTSANDDEWQSVQGYGDMSLREGLVWDIPLFGIFTPVLDGIMPGLGSSRATAGTGTFTITNGVLWSDDMLFQATGMRLKYRGSVDLESRVNSRVEAELLRDMWVVGPIVSAVLWPVTKLFEYRVTGTLEEPKLEPLYVVPKLVSVPFLPFRILKGLVQDESGSSRTNTLAPPKEEPK